MSTGPYKPCSGTFGREAFRIGSLGKKEFEWIDGMRCFLRNLGSFGFRAQGVETRLPADAETSQAT